MNISETCNNKDDQDGKLNLIVDLQVKPLNAADNDYVRDAFNLQYAFPIAAS